MKIALDPYMHRHLPLVELPRLAADLGYEYIELSPRADFLDWWVRPRVYPDRIRAFRKALSDHGVKLASLLPMYRWASPHEDERQAAVENWKRAVQVAVDMDCDTLNWSSGADRRRIVAIRHAAAASTRPNRARPPGGARWKSWSRLSSGRASTSTSSRTPRISSRRFIRPWT
jgi:sugar phosphate isomerase/epimerase